MECSSIMLQRPIGRIDHVLSRLGRLWHYYPQHSLFALVMETAIFANRTESDMPLISIEEIEDIAYPEGHLLHGIRHLEMGIDWLEKFHANEPLPPVPIQTAVLGEFADRWHRHPQQRLAQLLMNDHRRSEPEDQSLPNGD